jgi:Ca2+-binding RTX toxin-like protein
MRRLRWLGVAAAVCTAFVVLAATATTTIAGSRAGEISSTMTATELAPSQCAALVLSAIVAGTGTVNGTGGNDLILGGPGVDRLRGRGGSDCIVGGAGDDRIEGSGGRDVCIGGPGADTFRSCSTVYQ